MGIVVSTTLLATPAAAPADLPPRSIRRLRVTAWMLRRMLRDPRRMPGTWSAPGFAERLDRVRAQLLPIRSLAALADSFSREHGSDDIVVRLAYALRWLELTGALDERPWRLHWTAQAR